MITLMWRVYNKTENQRILILVRQPIDLALILEHIF